MILLTFYGITRPGEVLKTLRRELLLPADLVAMGSNTMYLKILVPKAQPCGLDLIQHAKIDEPRVTAVCQRLFGPLPHLEPLYPGSPAAFWRRWDHVLNALQVPASLRLIRPVFVLGAPSGRTGRTSSFPSSCGRCVFQISPRCNIMCRNLGQTMADSIFVQLPEGSKQAVTAASGIFDFLLTSGSRDGSP